MITFIVILSKMEMFCDFVFLEASNGHINSSYKEYQVQCTIVLVCIMLEWKVQKLKSNNKIFVYFQ